MSDNDIFPIEQMSSEEDKKITFSNLNKQILHNAKLEVSVDEENATLTVDLKDEKGEVISTKTVDLPNTGNIDCEVDEDTAELTVQLKNTKGEVVTSDTVQLPNTSNIDCEISEDMKLTVSLKNKSGQVVTSDTVQLQSAHVPSITQSEYDDLPEEEKTNGQIREITDAEGFPVPFAIMNDELTTSTNVLSAQETENRINAKVTETENKKYKLLWTNPTPNVAIANNTQFELGSETENYTFFLVEGFAQIGTYNNYNTNKTAFNGSMHTNSIIIKGETTFVKMGESRGGVTEGGLRAIRIDENKLFIDSDGFSKDSQQPNNNYGIPYKVWGIA